MIGKNQHENFRTDGIVLLIYVTVSRDIYTVMHITKAQLMVHSKHMYVQLQYLFLISLYLFICCMYLPIYVCVHYRYDWCPVKSEEIIADRLIIVHHVSFENQTPIIWKSNIYFIYLFSYLFIYLLFFLLKIVFSHILIMVHASLFFPVPPLAYLEGKTAV